jgi:hypothetical protein
VPPQGNSRPLTGASCTDAVAVQRLSAPATALPLRQPATIAGQLEPLSRPESWCAGQVAGQCQAEPARKGRQPGGRRPLERLWADDAVVLGVDTSTLPERSVDR